MTGSSGAPETVDFVVIGAGSSGSAVASRLSERERNSVALLEAGPSDARFWVHLPIGYSKTMWDPVLNWRFQTEPEPNLAGRRIYWPRGRVVGGCSSINGLIAIRGQAQDYDRWRDLGNPGWGYSEVLPYFLKSENNDCPGDGQRHGTSGPLHISSIKTKHDLIEAVIAAAGKLGVRRTEDFNGAEQEGAGYYQLTTHRGWRVSAARAYLAPAKNRRNLAILTNAHATRIVFEGKRAVGVSYVRGGKPHEIRAREGVVLSAGAVQSPQLLMLSGVGPAADLAKFGIAPIIERQSVGQNLQDHLQFRLVYRCTKPITTNDALRSIFGKARIGLQWLVSQGGPLAIGINQGGIFARVLPDSKTPDIQFHISTLSANMAGGKPHPFSGFTVSVCQLRPESRGAISLGSADPFAPPQIRANYLSAEEDRACAIAAIRFARELARTAPLSSYVAEEITPDPFIDTDAGILSFAQKSGSTIFHPVGTCRMGSDDDAVVDPRLRVRGAEKLWVVDCSVMPTLTSGNTNLPAIMIGEKASDMIAEDSRG